MDEFPGLCPQTRIPGTSPKILQQLQIRAQEAGVTLPFTVNTPYINTIAKSKQPSYPGNRELERQIKSIIRWNAMAMVVRGNHAEAGIGGHISTYASAATLLEVGFNHFFRARTDNFAAISFISRGHASPGVYARAFLEGRLNEEKLENFRRELKKRRRALLLSPSVAHAEFLAVSHRFHGARAFNRYLPGPVHALS